MSSPNSIVVTTQCYFFFVCAKALAATDFTVFELFFLRTEEAFDATFCDVCFLFISLPPLSLYYAVYTYLSSDQHKQHIHNYFRLPPQ